MLALIIKTGEIVEVLAMDSDTSCAVWIAYPGTDRDDFIARNAIELL